MVEETLRQWTRLGAGEGKKRIKGIDAGRM
jgi:hypothetical protein